MALTAFQRRIVRLLADRRRSGGESYIAGGVALNVALAAHRVSRDVDLFHDTAEAVAMSFEADRTVLCAAGYVLSVIRERSAFIEAEVSGQEGRLLIEWARDSAFRFFPLVEHEELGLTLHPFDLATNKVLALVGRLEVRDWIDVLVCDERLQPLGLLAWGACGKDPGFSPQAILEQAARTSRYTEEEVAALEFSGPPPQAADLARRWRRALEAAHESIAALPARHAGEAVLAASGDLFRGGAAAIREALSTRGLLFHRGRIGGALPTVSADR
ncbi:MAG: hypothetical protein LC791_13485 [Acidobacteria bacterium]|nr:hypothetical protein [Acidobacteriota bacterium]